MRRTQLYFEEDLWKVLHVRARATGSTVSELVRQAVRDKYLGDHEARKKAMESFVGLWRDRPEMADSEAYVRQLRQGRRLEQVGEK